MLRAQRIVAGGFVLVAGLTGVPACKTTNPDDGGGACTSDCGGAPTQVDATDATASRPNGQTAACGLASTLCIDGAACTKNDDCASKTCGDTDKLCRAARPDDNVVNGDETDTDCGGASAPKCGEGQKCLVDSDCTGACNYDHKCVDAPSCKPHLGGDTCGKGEVDEAGRVHESCCRTLPVAGYLDPGHPGKTVYLDKYEITAGRVRAFIADIAAKANGKPDIAGWVAANKPAIWDSSWNKFLPTDYEAPTVHIFHNLLGDVRGGADEPPPPAADQDQNVGVNFQFNGQLFVYLHGNNCSTHAPDAYGFATFFYPPEVLIKQGPDVFPPRADGRTRSGVLVPANEHLEVKSMNCITNVMLAAFCAWDGGQLATDEVLDYVTDSPSWLGNDPGCGSQIGTENPPTTSASQKGGRCADLTKINATYDAGGTLPLPNFPLNTNNYVFPFFPEGTFHDKAWEVAAPGRGSDAAEGEQVDMVRIKPGDEPWMDLAGNLSESVFTMNGAKFSGKFGLKYRGVGYQSSRSVLNTTNSYPGEGGLARIERPEARGGFAGGRCMRFK